MVWRNHRPEKGGNTNESGHSLRVSFWLITLALVPLSGAIWFAANELGQVRESRQRAEQVSVRSGELVQLTELRSRLLDERNWSTAKRGVQDLNLPLPFITELTGIDVIAHHESAKDSVDEKLGNLDWPEMEERVEEIRTDDSLEVELLNSSYETLAQVVGHRGDSSLDSLMKLSGDMDGAADLVGSLRVLEASADARQAITLQLTSYFGAQFSGADLARIEYSTLTEQSEVYRRSVSDVARIAASDSQVIKNLNSIETSSDAIAFRAALAQLLAAPPNDQDLPSGFSVASIMGNLDRVTETFSAGAASVEEHLELVHAAGDDVESTSRELDTVAAQRSRDALVRVTILTTISLLFVLSLSRAIGVPLGLLARRAQELRDGETTTEIEQLRPSGPTEIREAMRAINEAAAHIELAERQAHALASGNLDHPALTESSPGALGESLQDAVRTLAASLSQREEFRRRLTHEASHDGLTQLANRKASIAQLNQGLARTIRTESVLAIMFIDLDGFKDVNDTHGHPTGDGVLRTVGERLLTAVRVGDHVGRLGGDEFLVIAEPISGVTEAVALAERLASRIADPITIDGIEVEVGASVGIAIADSSTSLTGEELLRDADLAVYKAKELGRSRVELFDDELRAELEHRSLVEDSLRAALVGDELTLFYQPIVCPESGVLISLEALIRWERDDGLVPPDDFIPIAERSDLILAVDNWVVRKAAEQLVSWQSNSTLRDVPIAVNISGRHLATDSFVDDILRPLISRDLDPSLLVVEITESALLDDLGSAAAKLQQLRAKGVRIAIDDFGTGYTSLAHLRTLPVDILKIDRTFTSDESAQSLVKLIIDTGHLLGARITAEGIETHEQAAALTALGTDELQGYLFGRPIPAEAIEAPGNNDHGRRAA
ncbi:MAG: putative bifunctional diguanylate cyclase/phosphodiesterase [Acidimicrobiales bacterium]